MTGAAMHRRRLVRMLGLNVVCLVAAAAAAVGYLAGDVQALGPAFVAAIAAGVAAQVWFIVGIVRNPSTSSERA